MQHAQKRLRTGIYGRAGTNPTTGGDYPELVVGPHGDVPAKMLFQEYKQSIELPTADSRQDIAVPASAGAESGFLPNPTWGYVE
jgi:hypothetical protein